MLKRRQFIFGKQNINRHQPYVDDVVINISDEDAVMKFAPTKNEIIDMMKGGYPDGTVFNVSENDIEFVDTFIYYVPVQLLPEESQTKSIVGGPSAYHVGYMYRMTGGTVTLPNGNVIQMANPNSFVLFPGPILIHEGKLANLNITTEAIDFTEDFPYISDRSVFYPNLELESQFGSISGTRLIILAMVLGFDIEATEDESLIPENVLPHLGDTVEVTSDTMKYIEHKVQIGVDGAIK